MLRAATPPANTPPPGLLRRYLSPIVVSSETVVSGEQHSFSNSLYSSPPSSLSCALPVHGNPDGDANTHSYGQAQGDIAQRYANRSADTCANGNPHTDHGTWPLVLLFVTRICTHLPPPRMLVGQCPSWSICSSAMLRSRSKGLNSAALPFHYTMCRRWVKTSLARAGVPGRRATYNVFVLSPRSGAVTDFHRAYQPRPPRAGGCTFRLSVVYFFHPRNVSLTSLAWPRAMDQTPGVAWW